MRRRRLQCLPPLRTRNSISTSATSAWKSTRWARTSRDERHGVSFAEPGFQEFETSKYLTDILKQNGFTVEHGVAGYSTAWTAKWGSGKPVIALARTSTTIPQASQKPGVAWHEPIVEGAPRPR